MRKYLIYTVTVVLSTFVSSAQPKVEFTEWQNPEINQIGRLSAHTDLETGKDSPFYMSLNGTWKFNWVEHANQRPDDFYEVGFDDSSWETMPVPGNWELNGYGDPVYINIGYAWRGWYKDNPPYVPVENNHVGSYRKSFQLPQEWKNMQVRLHIGSATSNIYVWCNGEFVGYSEDSKMEAEFDLTGYLKKGQNLLALQIFRWCDGTYLEDQDYIRLSGIGRDCYLYALPEHHIEDIRISTPLEADYTSARMVADIITSCTNVKGCELTCSIYDRNGNLSAAERIGMDGSNTQISMAVPDVNLWSAETPYLYKAVFCLKDKGGNTLHEVEKKIGFRDVRIENGQLKVNGKAILIKGVNRHETDPDFGHYISYERALEDARIMKENNINAVRTCHYPDADDWYDICDEVGLYVVAEANIESHGMGYGSRTLAANPVYAKAHLERNQRNVIRNWSHPSVIIWSLGNEAGDGPNFDACYDWIRSMDPSRPIQYERAKVGRNTDVFCPMYATYEKCRKYLESNPTKPLIQCEYAHAMGNSEGGLKEYWDLVRQYPMYQGGFIWDYVDQAVRKTGVSGKKVLGYGGDWNKFDPTDDNFCANGLISPERKLNPHMHEVRFCYQNIWTEIQDASIVIRNENFFKSLDNVMMNWSLLQNGQSVLHGSIDLNGVEPQSSLSIPLPFDTSLLDSAFENILNLSFVLKNSEPLLQAGHETAKAEHILTPYAFVSEHTYKGMLNSKESDETLVISDGAYEVSFDKSNGFISGYRYHGKELMADGSHIRPNFWRAVTDNDFGAKLHLKFSAWKNPDIILKDFSARTEDSNIVVRSSYAMPSVKSHLTMEYVVNAGGIINATMHLVPDGEPMSDMFRFGVRFEMPSGFEILEYYGRGPHENYSDRCSSALLGIYRQTVDEQFHPYVRPQETGTHSDLRWWEVKNTANWGIRITSDAPFNASALHYSIESLDEGLVKHNTHPEELIRSPYTWVCIDSRQMGLGCENSWGRLPLQKYMIRHQEQSFSFTLSPVGLNNIFPPTK